MFPRHLQITTRQLVAILQLTHLVISVSDIPEYQRLSAVSSIPQSLAQPEDPDLGSDDSKHQTIHKSSAVQPVVSQSVIGCTTQL
jgi:hypothetical protein